MEEKWVPVKTLCGSFQEYSAQHPLPLKIKRNGNDDKMKTVLCKSDMFLMICLYMYGTYKINQKYQGKQAVFSISFMKRKPKYLQTNVPVYNIHFKILR